jgi:hypothetical protein
MQKFTGMRDSPLDGVVEHQVAVQVVSLFGIRQIVVIQMNQKIVDKVDVVVGCAGNLINRLILE